MKMYVGFRRGWDVHEIMCIILEIRLLKIVYYCTELDQSVETYGFVQPTSHVCLMQSN